jgi:hypothetical protein
MIGKRESPVVRAVERIWTGVTFSVLYYSQEILHPFQEDNLFSFSSPFVVIIIIIADSENERGSVDVILEETGISSLVRFVQTQKIGMSLSLPHIVSCVRLT